MGARNRRKDRRVFEGRDAAGKGGTIKRITEYLSPRIARIAAPPAPNDRGRGQWYYQHYVPQLPAKGEIVLLDRSWYHRRGVEKVMRFCTAQEHSLFLRQTPIFELMPAVEAQPDGSGIGVPVGLLAGEGPDDGSHRHAPESLVRG